MGKIIEFRSSFRGTGHVTSCLAAVAACLSVNPDISVAVTQTPGRNAGLQELFDHHITRSLREEVYKKTGLSALVLMFKGGRLGPQKVRECALRTVNPNLDIFPAGPMLMEDCSREDDEAVRGVIIREMAKAYDYVLVDCGTDNCLKEKGDLTVCLLPQNARAWRHYFGNGREDKDTLYVINGYMKSSVSNLRTFRFHYRRELTAIPMSVGFMDAMASGAVPELFWTGKMAGRMLADHEFIENVEKLTRSIREGGMKR